MAEMEALHGLLVGELTRRLDPRTRARPPGVETLAVVLGLLRQEPTTAMTDPKLRKKVKKLERLHADALLEALTDGRPLRPSMLAEVGALLRRLEREPGEAPVSLAGPSTAAEWDVPFSA